MNEQNIEHCHLLKLPTELILEILKDYTPTVLVTEVAPLCKQLYTLSKSNVFWGRWLKPKAKEKHPDNQKDRFIHHFDDILDEAKHLNPLIPIHDEILAIQKSFLSPHQALEQLAKKASENKQAYYVVTHFPIFSENLFYSIPQILYLPQLLSEPLIKTIAVLFIESKVMFDSLENHGVLVAWIEKFGRLSPEIASRYLRNEALVAIILRYSGGSECIEAIKKVVLRIEQPVPIIYDDLFPGPSKNIPALLQKLQK